MDNYPGNITINTTLNYKLKEFIGRRSPAL